MELVMHLSRRSDTFCLTGSITVMIYEEEEPNITVMPYTARAGGDTDIVCPHLKYFKSSENPKWYKDFQSTALPIGKGQYTVERGIILAIKNISVKDEGFYTCRLSVIFNNTQYNVSRTWRVQVSLRSSSHSFPYIVFPANGSFTESHLGARLVIQCMVSVGNQLAQSTDVTSMGNDQPPENSDLATREMCLLLLSLDSESVWLVAAAASSCFMLVLCAFAYHLSRRPQKPRDYVLARQDSAM
ncbi:interleukin-1 receptor type 2-like [Sinocyclocheilus anshuiensis]|uniref:interleukin-1 receptor type 2-like n=1 Tax=Sinocyclocheilus anshuiensis TaxID=1608454 RepID=UPI0007BA4DC5|nr:PREDICTED: interleukin-1 receptor type 2-like [Sinocyclocheilus anshuiensis]